MTRRMVFPPAQILSGPTEVLRSWAERDIKVLRK